MEESPHKCPVCSRSFNQRSNLKTHLLTHTDHKPYECSACGKVFRRNCDLRRHALTHSVGDVPPSDPTLQVEGDGDDEYYMARDKRGMSDNDDDDDEVLEVDSPDHSPVRRSATPKTGNDLPVTTDAPKSNSPCASSSSSHRSFGLNKKVSRMIFGRALDQTDSENEQGDDINVDSRGAGSQQRRICNESERFESVSETNSNHSLGGGSSSEVTHCHHEGFIGPHYTMRPHYDYYSPLSLVAAAAAQKMSSSSPSGKPATNSFVPVLHVRRDLHHKSPMISGHPSTITSPIGGGVLTMHDPPGPSFLGSIPVRKRSMGANGETQLTKPATTNNFHPSMRLATSEHSSFGSHHSPSSQATAKAKESALSSTPGSSKDVDKTAAVSTTKPPQKKTGFSIEDIMRR